MSAAVRCIERGEFVCDSQSKYVCQINSDMLLIAGLLLALMSVTAVISDGFYEHLLFVKTNALDPDPHFEADRTEILLH